MIQWLLSKLIVAIVSKLIEKLKQLALSAAPHQTGRYRVACAVLDKKDRILAIGQNSYSKTHPTQKRHAVNVGEEHKEYLHAEISALVKIRNGEPYKITVVRVGANGSLLNAKPCKICAAAIKEAGIKIIEHTV